MLVANYVGDVAEANLSVMEEPRADFEVFPSTPAASGATPYIASTGALLY
jgi:hypothetical protein